MPAEVILKVNKGSLKGKEFSFEMRESFVIGRSSDCPVCFSDNTVSRYHCHMDINPPNVTVRDLGALNGTRLNGKLIGQRDPSLSPEEAQKIESGEFQMKSGDKLCLGKECEIEVIVKESVIKKSFTCTACRRETDEEKYKNADGLPICKNCYNRWMEIQKIIKGEKGNENKKPPKPTPEPVRVPEQKPKPTPEPVRVPEQKPKPTPEPVRVPEQKPKPQPQNDKCYVCGGALDKGSNGTNICAKCRKNPVNILQLLLNLAMQGKGETVNIAGFKNIKLLGQGGMGQVWLVENEKTSERMALKIMLPDCARDEKSIKIFLREAYTGCALKNANVVEHFKFGRSGNIFFILMELCKGGSVDKLLTTKGGSLGRNEQDMAIATSITLQVLDGLYFAHNALIPVVIGSEAEKRKGVVHRDFKPGNIFIANADLSRPIAKVADFGLAKAFDAAGLTSNSRDGGTCGTIVFMPRQQLRDSRYVKPDVDVWATAASYYNMLTGQLVRDFRGRTGGELYREVINNSPVPIRKRNSQIPEQLARVIDAVLQEEPKIGIHKMIKEMYGTEPKDEHVEALVFKKKIWESLTPGFREKVRDILPENTMNNLMP